MRDPVVLNTANHDPSVGPKQVRIDLATQTVGLVREIFLGNPRLHEPVDQQCKFFNVWQCPDPLLSFRGRAGGRVTPVNGTLFSLRRSAVYIIVRIKRTRECYESASK